MNKSSLGTVADRRAQVAEVADIIGNGIGRDAVRIDVIAEKIRLYNAYQPPTTWPPWPQSKDEKKIAKSFGLALTRLEEQFAELDDKPEEKPEEKFAKLKKRVVLERAVHGAEDEFFEWKGQLTRWRKCFETFGGKATANRSTLFPNEEFFPNGKPKPSWPLGKKRSSKRVSKADFKHDAAAAAAAILDAHDIPVTATQKSATQELSIFCKVAAKIARDDRIYHACRTLVKKRKTR
jgi:hypothetical protein